MISKIGVGVVGFGTVGTGVINILLENAALIRRRVGVPMALRDTVVDAVHERIAYCWSVMDQQLAPSGPYLLGQRLTVLDLYVNVVSRFGPWREAFAAAAPRMAPRVAHVDADARLAPLWHDRFRFE